jgi:predicted Zn-dependent peptidase
LRTHQLDYAVNFLTATTHRDRLEFDFAFTASDSKKIDKLVELIQEPLMVSQAVLKREMAILLRELSEEEAEPDYDNNLAESTWLYAKPFTQPNGGTQASIRTITAEQLRQWHEKYIRRGCGLFITNFAVTNKVNYLPFNHHPIINLTSKFGPVRKAGAVNLERANGDDAVVRAYCFVPVRNESENNFSVIMNYYLTEQLKQYFDANGESYYFGADMYIVGNITEHSLSATIPLDAVERTKRYLADLMQSLATISEADFIILRENVRRSLVISEANPQIQFENAAFAAAVWGDDWQSYKRASEELKSVSYMDFQKFIQTTKIMQGGIWRVTRAHGVDK